MAHTKEDADGCWIWTGRINNRGYPVITVRVPGKKNPVKVYAHRAMLEISTGFRFPFDEAGHFNCHKPLCIHPDCLEIQTKAHNLADRRGYAVKDSKACWIPTLFPIEEETEFEHDHPRPSGPAGDCPF